MEIAVQLHTDAIDEAIAGIDRLVEKETHADYLLLSLNEALKKVRRELHRVMESGSLEGEHARLQAVLERVLAQLQRAWRLGRRRQRRLTESEEGAVSRRLVAPSRRSMLCTCCAGPPKWLGSCGPGWGSNQRSPACEMEFGSQRCISAG